MGAPLTLLAFVAALLSATACPYAAGAAGSEAVPAADVQHRKLTTSCPKGNLQQGLTDLYTNTAQAKQCFQSAVQIIGSKWDKKYAGPVLRMAFHDCGTYSKMIPDTDLYGVPGLKQQCGGCNGSFKQEFEYGRSIGFSHFGEQNGMQLAYDFFWGSIGVANMITSVPACAKMSNADIISLSGYVAVQKAGGSPYGGCAWYPGRKDNTVGYDDTTNLPPASGDATVLKGVFDAYDFQPALDMFKPGSIYYSGQSTIENMYEAVSLYSSAHTIGQSRVHDKSPISVGLGSMSSTPDSFDGSYFSEVMSATGYKGMAGWFESDRHGLCTYLPNPTQELSKRVCKTKDSLMFPYYQKYANNYQQGKDYIYKGAFCNALQAMSTIGYELPGDYMATSAQFIL